MVHGSSDSRSLDKVVVEDQIKVLSLIDGEGVSFFSFDVTDTCQSIETLDHITKITVLNTDILLTISFI